MAGDLDLQERRRFHAELLRYASIRRYRSGWTRRTYRERFRAKVPADWVRDEHAQWIRPETYAWLRARAAAYARSLELGGWQ
jgi:hypothetical protein